MHRPDPQTMRTIGAGAILSLLTWLVPTRILAQSGAGTGYETRGDRGEIDVTVHDSAGNLIATPAAVKLYLDGAPYDQGATSKGRVFFILRKLGDFEVIVEATGFKPEKKDVRMDIPIKTEVDITLKPETSNTPAVGVAGDPVLAPKAKESLDTAIHDLREGDLSGADKAIGEAMKLAPNHPDVLYVQGMLDLQRHEWAKAQGVLEKSAQIEPNHARTQAALGMALCNQKKYQEAIAPLEKSVQLDPNSGWETNWSLAQAYYHTERYDEAFKAAEQAETDSAGHAPQVDLLLAQTMVAVGRFEESATVLRGIIKNHSGAPEAATAQRFLDRLSADGKIKKQ
ncbi:MAG: tetratricopeptide repeat protein [Candidatus Acidiferrum sp.]